MKAVEIQNEGDEFIVRISYEYDHRLQHVSWSVVLRTEVLVHAEVIAHAYVSIGFRRVGEIAFPGRR